MSLGFKRLKENGLYVRGKLAFVGLQDCRLGRCPRCRSPGLIFTV